MTPSEDEFCQKCGASIAPTASFCSKCGAPKQDGLNSPVTAQRMYWKEYRFARRKGDKLGPLIGGLMVIWLGVTLYLAQTPYIVHSEWWAYFFIGAGVILILSGLYRWKEYSYRYPPAGYIIGGLFLLVIGLAGVVPPTSFGPGILIVIGVVIIVFGIYSMRPKNAPPKSAEPAPA